MHPLKRWMDDNEKTQVWVAQYLGVSQPSVSHVLSGKGAFSPEVALKAVRMTKGAVRLEQLVLKYNGG